MFGASAAAVMVLFTSSAAAAPGDLDPTFGTDGVVQTQVGSYSSNASGLVLQPDGRILVGGSTAWNTIVARYLPDGRLDSTFGSGGIGSAPYVSPSSITLQGDGKVLLAGVDWSNTVAVVRFEADGGLDMSFGSGGVARGPSGEANGIAVQPDGRIVLAGSSWEGYERTFLVLRMKSDGSLDSTFGSGGVVRTHIGNSAQAAAVVLQADGKIVAAGGGSPATTSPYGVMALARYLSDGALDSGFGAGGISTAKVGGTSSSVSSIALQPNGKLVAGGTADGRFGVARFLSNGALDPSFGTNGSVTTGVDSILALSGLALQSDGKIVVAGAGRNTFALGRYDSNGRIDTTFGEGGVATNPISRYSRANAVVVQPDGRIVAAGYSSDSGNAAITLARFVVTTPTSISAEPHIVDFGARVQLSGTLTNRRAGTVNVLEQACGADSRSPTTTTSAGADGTWSASVTPASQTVYWAGVELERSSPVTIRVRPRLTLKRVGARRLRARAHFGVSLATETVVLQRHTKARGWIDYRYRTLRRVATSDFVSGATFPIARQPGRRLRLVLPQDGLFDCFASSSSKAIRG